MKRICEICNKQFKTNSLTRIYCYDCSGESIGNDNIVRKHQRTILRWSMKLFIQIVTKKYIVRRDIKIIKIESNISIMKVRRGYYENRI